MKFNIRLKLVLFTFSIVLLVGGSISLHSLFLGQRRMLASFEDDARQTAALIAGAIVNDIYFLDLRSLHRRLESARLNSDVMSTLIMDLDGAVLSDGTSANVLRDKKPTDPFTVALLQANGWVSKVEGGLLKVGGPVFMPDRTRVGYLSVSFSLEGINEAVRETTRSDLYLTALAFGIAFVLAFALAASFSRPVLTVTRAAKDIGEGRLDTRLSVSRSDEFGTLAQSVNLMAETLQRRDEQLENMVAERTRELQQANEALLRDMAERKKLEEQLLQAQKMEGIGTLAGGIAHDFNNILNIIQGYASLLRGYGSRNKQIGESLAVINETVERGSALVQQLLTLARKSSTDFEWVNANVLIEELIALISQTFPKTIELSSTLEPDLPPITADKNQIQQALLNLCVNARDAMPKGGRLIFKTQSVDGAALRDLGGTMSDRYVCIEVSDSGMGMDESTRKRIFEPFFTTKDIGKGSGLGLSVVYGIVQNHGGFINVESKPASGTSFRLHFPASASDVCGKEPIFDLDTETTATTNGAATVLLIEDEQNMLNLLERLLLKHGYRVLKATDGEMALEIYRCHEQTIDAVLLDIGLPKIAGRDVLLKIKNENPDVKIIIASGYLEPELKAEIEQAGVKYFLHKPYMLDEMVMTLQSLIEK